MPNRQLGVTLIETIVFIVVVSIALGALLRVFQQASIDSVDPVVKTKALEVAQATLDEILSRKFADNTPTGGVPACDPCSAIGTGPGFNDVGDYNGYTDNSDPNFRISVSVTDAGGDLGIAANNARLVTVTVDYIDSNPLRSAGRGRLSLSAYRVNF